MDKRDCASAMVKALPLLLFLATACFGQALYTFRDQAFLGAVQPIIRAATNIPNGLVAYWKMNEGSGATAYDSTTNALNMTLTGSATWGRNAYPYTNCIYFPAPPPSYLSSSPSALLANGTNDFSVTMWFNKTNSWSGNEGLMQSRDPISAQYHLIIGTDSGAFPRLSFSVGHPTGFVLVQGPLFSTIQENTWHFLSITRISTNYTMWLDGIQVGTNSSSISTVVAGGPPVAYLGTVSPFYVFGGLMEEVMFRNGAVFVKQTKAKTENAEDWLKL